MGIKIILLLLFNEKQKKICKIQQGGIIRGEEKMDANKLALSNQELDIIFISSKMSSKFPLTSKVDFC